MTKTIFEKMGGTYEKQGDYFIPCLNLPTDKKTKSIGVWGQRHARYLKQNHKVLYMNLLTSSKLNSYLSCIDEQADEMFSRLVKQYAKAESVTEALKAEQPLEWGRRINNICNRVTEIVNNDLIYT